MVDTFFIFGAKYLFLLSFVIAGVFFLKQGRSKQKKILIFSFFSLLLIGFLAVLGSHVFYNARPFVVGNFIPLVPHAPDNGFPSDHTLLVSAIAAVFSYFNKRVATALWLIVLVVGVSRVYVGVHHAVDIIGSIIITGVATYAVFLYFKNIRGSDFL